ncbi:hypothetical protein D0862_05374 [Hortaea werneckii]|uniref:Glutaminase A n=1 Tax=Hortaea werneckii TaxID=91943 RepID=A0A3M7GU53_HORWE|nr:hypothetical protein D0862_05374 [Hortaea werneckii]
MASVTAVFTLAAAALANAQSSFTPARPPALPLAVRSPYLNTHLAAGSDGGNGGYLAGEWPSFWNGAITGWTGFIRVDNTTYTWLGNPLPLPQVVDQASYEYTSTRSKFELQAGPVTMDVTFLSPVTPDDLTAQSFPITYVSVAVSSSDGGEHDVKLYTDVSAEWASGDRSKVAQWDYGTTESNVVYHKFWRHDQEEFIEDDQQAAWGFWYYATADGDGLTHQSGADTDVRDQFTSNGLLENTEDTDYRAINDAYPVFGFAKDLGSVGSDSVETVFTINIAQDNTVQYRDGNGVESIPSYWANTYQDYESALDHFYGQYQDVSSQTADLDSRVASDSTAAGGDDYLTLTSLAVRQAWAALAVSGTPDEPLIFLKEISSNGDIQTVDVIIPTFPIILYFNPGWLKLLLDPIVRYQEAGLFTQGAFALHDLGVFPKATEAGPEQQPVEECGNMIIMALAYAQRTGDTGYLTQHYDLLNQYTGYLVNDSLYPDNQISTDDFAGSLANQTNLALKGMIGIKAMSMIAQMTGHADDSSNYADIAESYIAQWQDLGIAQDANPPHTTLSYGDNSSHGLLYNLYSDSLLETHLVPTSVYEMQSNFYPTVANKYGVPLDTRHGYTKNDWEMFCAAIAAPDTRALFISDTADFINQTPSNGPVTDLYETDTADYANGIRFMARPVVGGWFSLLVLNQTGIPEGNTG